MQMTTEQFDLVKRQFATLKERSPFYAAKFADIDLAGRANSGGLREAALLRKGRPAQTPTRWACRRFPTRKWCASTRRRARRARRSIIPYTQQDVTDWAIQFARCYETAGITRADRIQITPGYGLWTAGIGFQLGAERLGAMAIPMGPGNTEKQLKMMNGPEVHGSGRHQFLRPAAGRGDKQRGIRDKLCLRKGVIGSRALGREDAPTHCGRAGRGDLRHLRPDGSVRPGHRHLCSGAPRHAPVGRLRVRGDRRSRHEARPCPTAKWASWC